MILSHSKKFMFFCNPKTGTTSIESVLGKFDEGCGEDLSSPGLFLPRHAPASVVRSLLTSEIWDEYFKFVFVRDPLDWVVSTFRYNFPTPSTYVRKFYWAPTRIRETIVEYFTYRRQSHTSTLDAADIDFLHDYLRRFRCIPSYATQYQSSYVLDADGVPIVDHVGRLETLAEDARLIADRIGIPIEVPHLNRSVRKSPFDSLTDCAIEAIYDYWAKDYDVLGYEKTPVSELRRLHAERT